MSKVAFTRNHDGDPLVIIDNCVQGLVVDCAGYEYIKNFFEAKNNVYGYTVEIAESKMLEMQNNMHGAGYRKLTPEHAKMYDDKTHFFGENV